LLLDGPFSSPEAAADFQWSGARWRGVPLSASVKARWREGVFTVDEATLVNTVTVNEQALSPWNPNLGLALTPDYVGAVPTQRNFTNGDANNYGTVQVTYDIPGTVVVHVSGVEQGATWESALASSIFDRFARGGLYTELACTPDITDQIGDEIVLDVPQLPNLNVRGGDRCLQIVRRTETPTGPVLRLLDSGTTAQFGTAPTFSLAAGPDARSYVALTVTNAAALNAAGAALRIEWGFGTSSPSGAGALLYRYPIDQASGLGTIPVDAITLPRVDAGTHVWVRMRSEGGNLRPSAFTVGMNAPPRTLVS
jgi:hypothetical protein